MAETPRQDLKRQVERLEERLAETREELAAIKDQQAAVAPSVVEALGLDTPTGRRQALKYAGGAATLPALLAYAASDQAQADAVAADVGTQADPWQKGWFHALAAGDGADALGFDSPLALNHNAISSATTITAAQVVPYDCSVSGFTITLGNELQQNGGWVVLIDQTGSAGTKTVTIDPEGATNIDGASSITVEHNHAVTIAWWDGSEWRTTRFIDTVDARQLSVGSSALVSEGDFLAVGPSSQGAGELSTTSTSYVSDGVDFHQDIIRWDEWVPAGAQGAFYASFRVDTSSGDVRLRNVTDSETVFEELNTGNRETIGPANYTPTTTNALLTLQFEVRTDDGGTASALRGASVNFGVQV